MPAEVQVVAYMGVWPKKLENGVYWSPTTCSCSGSPLRAVVKDGKFVEAGCPVCDARGVVFIECGHVSVVPARNLITWKGRKKKERTPRP